MSGDFHNPYRSPLADSQSGHALQDQVRGRVSAPAIALMVVAAIGMLFSCYNVFHALTADESMIDPNAPEFLQEMARNSMGTLPAVVQSIFVIVNIVIIAGAYFMSRIENRGMALTATVLAMLNFGSFCCLLGIPVGIWSLVTLMQPDVKAAFAVRQ